MRLQKVTAVLLLCGAAGAQPTAVQEEDSQPKLKSRTENPNMARRREPPASGQAVVVPIGTKIPLQLRQPISTKGARPGDPIYAQTTFPVVADGSIVIPAGTWVQGEVDEVKRAGRVKGTAELRFHLTKLIYGNSYMVDIKAAIDQVPGDTGSNMKEPGTVKHDSEHGKDLENVGRAASMAGQIGALAGAGVRPSWHGYGVGGLTGVAAGALIGILARGSDVTFPTGTAVEIALTQPMAVERQTAAGPAGP
jgi:hypothetical protein